MKHICFVLDSYPTKTSNGCVFAKHLIWAIADMGVKCTVIAARPITIESLKNEDNCEKRRIDITDNGSEIEVFSPLYLHLSSNKRLMKKSMDNHFKAVLKVMQKNKIEPDVMYGHFIYQCGLTASRVASLLNIPAYCACGENSLRLEKNSHPYCTGLKYCNWNELLSSLTGVVSVSQNNLNLLVENGFIDKDKKAGVFPNGINSDKFFVTNRENARKELGFPQEAFIVAYTGTFKESKGIVELCEALKNCEDTYSIFMGKGQIAPDCENILFCASVPNDRLYLYLNAADVFVLPTKGEGCCNAIVEALACGLPVVSSNLPFNDDVLDESNSIRVNVNNVQEIENAIRLLKNDKSLYDRLSEGAVKSAEKLSITTRAKNILRFMELI